MTRALIILLIFSQQIINWTIASLGYDSSGIYIDGLTKAVVSTNWVKQINEQSVTIISKL